MWRFGAAYAVLAFIVEAAVFGFIVPFSQWLLFAVLAFSAYPVTLIVQFLIKRARPPQHGAHAYRLWIQTYSFPSAHASGSFVCAVLGTAAAFAYVPVIAPYVLAGNVVVACFVAASRVAVGVHYASDAIVGALLGAGLGTLFLLAL